LKFSKTALIPVGLASTAALAIGLLPIPFVDWPLIVATQVSMFAGICVAFKLKVNKGIFVWLTTVGLGSFGVGVGLLRMIANALKLIPGVNVPAMIIDGTFSFGGTFIMGLAFIAILRQLYIKGVDLSKMTEEEQKEKIKKLFLSEIKAKWKQWRSTSTKAVLREETKLTDGICISSSTDFDVDKFCEVQDNLLKQDKLKMSEQISIIEDLKRDNKTLNDVCRMCWTCKPNITLKPCGHTCVCEKDYIDYISRQLIKLCPECNSDIDSYEKTQ
jgi:uncharacterized protein (DUF697 family)